METARRLAEVRGQGFIVFGQLRHHIEGLDVIGIVIENALKAQKMQAAIHSMESSATSKLDDKYFGPAPGPGSAGTPGMGPGPVQPPMRPPPSPVQPPNNQ